MHQPAFYTDFFFYWLNRTQPILTLSNGFNRANPSYRYIWGKEMSDELASPYGYPLRRNSSSSCLASEQDCSPTWGTFRRCCPHGTSCADDCCPSTADCQQRIKANPHCANDSADLYRAVDANGSPAGGYFCCTTNAIGFQRATDSWVGCADSVDLLNSSFSLASLEKRAPCESTTGLPHVLGPLG